MQHMAVCCPTLSMFVLRPQLLSTCMAEIPKRQILVAGITLTVVQFADRRDAAHNMEVEFLFQSQLEQLLFGCAPYATTGACYRLLARAGVGGRALSLRRASVVQELLSAHEYDDLRGVLHSGVRSFTLVPVEAVQEALCCFGQTPVTQALLAALGLPMPEDWVSVQPVGEGGGEGDEEGEEEVEEEEEEMEVVGDRSDGGDKDESNGGDPDGSDEGSGGEASGCSDASRSHHGDDDSHSDDEKGDRQDGGSGREGEAEGRHRFPSLPISDALEKELRAFERFRVSVINRGRGGRAVATSTAKDDRLSVLHFFSWLMHVKGVAAPSFGLFSSDRMGATIEQFIEEKEQTCKHARIANILASLVAASRFTRAARQAKVAAGDSVSQKPLDELVALHKQVLGEARQVCGHRSYGTVPQNRPSLPITMTNGPFERESRTGVQVQRHQIHSHQMAVLGRVPSDEAPLRAGIRAHQGWREHEREDLYSALVCTAEAADRPPTRPRGGVPALEAWGVAQGGGRR